MRVKSTVLGLFGALSFGLTSSANQPLQDDFQAALECYGAADYGYSILASGLPRDKAELTRNFWLDKADTLNEGGSLRSKTVQSSKQFAKKGDVAAFEKIEACQTPEIEAKVEQAKKSRKRRVKPAGKSFTRTPVHIGSGNTE